MINIPFAVTVMLFLGLAVGNFLCQAVAKKPNWESAFERSFFQLAALITAAVFTMMSQP